MSAGGKESLAVRALSWLAGAICRRPGWFAWPQVVLFVASVGLTVFKLGFDLDRNALVGEDKDSHRNFLAMRREFPGQDDIVVVVESDDVEKNRQFVERLGARLEAESAARNPTNVFGEVFYKGDLRLMGSKALLFSPQTNLVEFARVLGEYRPFLDRFTAATNLPSLFRQVNQLIRATGRERGAQADRFVQMLPAMERLLRMMTAALSRPGNPPSPGVEALFGGGAEAEREKYITFADGRLYLVSARPRLVTAEAKDVSQNWWERLTGRPADATPKRIQEERFSRQGDVNGHAIERMRELVASVRSEVPGVNVGITGESVLDRDEMQQSQVDSTVATVLSLALCALIFVVGYRQTGRPLKATLCLVVGLGYTMGWTTLAVGHLNILTITFVPMLVGLAIDFGVHLVTRFEEELRHGRTKEEAIYKAIVYTGQGIFTGCFTTAGAFLAMALTEFRGIREMGIITGGGMLLCLVPMITLLPVLLLRGSQNEKDRVAAAARSTRPAETDAPDLRARLERLWLDRPRTVIGVTAALSLLAAVKLPTLHFDYNLLHMQNEALASVAYEHKLIASAEKAVLYGAMVADTLEEAADLERRARELPTVSTTDSMARFLSENQTEKLRLVGEVKAAVEGLRFAAVDPSPVNLGDLNLRLLAFGGYMALAEDALTGEPEEKLRAQVHALRGAVTDLVAALAKGDAARHSEKLGAFQRAFLGELRELMAAVRDQDNSGALRVEDLPTPLRSRFVGKTGKHLVQVYPRSNVWNRVEQEAFVRDLRTVDPRATGTPVQLYEYTSLLKDSYVEAAWWALGAIVVLVFLHFRSVMPVLLSLLPVAVGALWMVGFMGWAGIPFNPANIMTLPLVIGIGVTNGIHILNRFAEERNPGILAKSTGKAVLVSGLTTIAGFGSLIVGEHRGIQSLGWVMAAGTATCMVAGLTFLPAILTLREGMAVSAEGEAGAASEGDADES
ncbi:MAG: MMPL family transporter [Verrucomicrobiota bacterium]